MALCKHLQNKSWLVFSLVLLCGCLLLRADGLRAEDNPLPAHQPTEAQKQNLFENLIRRGHALRIKAVTRESDPSQPGASEPEGRKLLPVGGKDEEDVAKKHGRRHVTKKQAKAKRQRHSHG